MAQVKVYGIADHLTRSRRSEITITETPKQNWGFRGLTGDAVTLDYKVEV